jgi:hypothetical protein
MNEYQWEDKFEQSMGQLERRLEAEIVREVARRETLIVAFIRQANSDGSTCSADHEVLAQRIERGEHLK